jgi:hypothetical protein
MVLLHPAQKPLSGSIRQIPLQGEATDSIAALSPRRPADASAAMAQQSIIPGAMDLARERPPCPRFGSLP